MGAATTSCEDMFAPENSHVTTDLTPQDTVYQMMGIVGKMQKVADRTVLLGELRADLVNVTSSADKNLSELVAAAKVGVDNKYNNPADYYGIINSCNIYLAHVDSLLKVNGIYKFEKEVISAKTFRAWAYLELAKLYGNVPFVEDPVISADAAENIINSAPSKTLTQICDYFISDLEKEVWDKAYENNGLRPSYGSSYADASLANCFVPLRLILGDLYLWRASFTSSEQDYKKAAAYYHSFLTFKDEEKRTTSGWTNTWKQGPSGSSANIDFSQKPSYLQYYNMFTNFNEILAFIPMDVKEYQGTYSELTKLFSSQYSNNYYASINPSKRIREISQAQTYCTYSVDWNQAFYPQSKNPNDYPNNDELLIGDLRLKSILETGTLNSNNQAHSDTYQFINKYNVAPLSNSLSWNTDENLKYVILYRTAIVYLRMAEALSHGGYPETAFAILKYGLSNEILNTDSIVPQSERERLVEIIAPGSLHDFTYWGEIGSDNRTFKTLSEDWRTVDSYSAPNSDTHYQRGIHDYGCGESYKNQYYTVTCDSTDWRNLAQEIKEYDAAWHEANDLPVRPKPTDEEKAEYEVKYLQYKEDSTALHTEIVENNNAWYLTQKEARQVVIDSLILEEMALEGMFEGHRFYDLMRYAKYKGNNDELAKRIAKRAGKDNEDAALRGFFANEQNWYLELPKR